MKNRILLSIDRLNEKNVNWEQGINEYYNEKSSSGKELLEAFWSLIECLSEAVMRDIYTVEECLSFIPQSQKRYVEEKLNSRLRPYFACGVVRKNQIDQKGQIENLIDEIWKRYVKRRSLNYISEILENVNIKMTEDEIEELVKTILALVDHSIMNMLDYNSILYTINKQTGVSEDLCQYIARKIDKDYEDLRTNYIIRRLSAQK